MPNIVYVLKNEAMPGLVKIGLTSDSVSSRISQLNNHSGVPIPFECYFAAEVEDSSKLEKTLHQLFSDNRVNPKREFFNVDPEKVVLAISIGEFKEITPGVVEIDKDEQAALDKVKARKKRLTLDALNIKAGARLTFSRDEEIIVEVVGGGKVKFKDNDEEYSLSAAAVKSLRSCGYNTNAANGSNYWIFEGELLDERRCRMGSEQSGENFVNE